MCEHYLLFQSGRVPIFGASLRNDSAEWLKTPYFFWIADLLAIPHMEAYFAFATSRKFWDARSQLRELGSRNVEPDRLASTSYL